MVGMWIGGPRGRVEQTARARHGVECSESLSFSEFTGSKTVGVRIFSTFFSLASTRPRNKKQKGSRTFKELTKLDRRTMKREQGRGGVRQRTGALGGNQQFKKWKEVGGS